MFDGDVRQPLQQSKRLGHGWIKSLHVAAAVPFRQHATKSTRPLLRFASRPTVLRGSKTPLDAAALADIRSNCSGSAAQSGSRDPILAASSVFRAVSRLRLVAFEAVSPVSRHAAFLLRAGRFHGFSNTVCESLKTSRECLLHDLHLVYRSDARSSIPLTYNRAEVSGGFDSCKRVLRISAAG